MLGKLVNLKNENSPISEEYPKCLVKSPAGLRDSHVELQAPQLKKKMLPHSNLHAILTINRLVAFIHGHTGIHTHIMSHESDN